MANERHLPQTEFELMKLIWEAHKSGETVTTAYLMERYGSEKGWRTPTLITLLNRLIDRGILSSDKPSKERTYTPLISEDEYMRGELEAVAKRYDGPLAGLFCALANRTLSEKDAAELAEWLDSHPGGEGK